MTLEKRIENLELATNTRQAGVFLFWYRGAANGNFDFPRAPELTDEAQNLLLVAEWIGTTDFHDGDGFCLCFDYGIDGVPVWRLNVGESFHPLWTDGADFLEMALIEEIKSLSAQIAPM